MKLFYQLTPEQQDNALHECLFQYVIDDLLTSDNVELASDDVSDVEEARVKDKVKSLVDECKKLGDDQWDEKIDILLGDEEVNMILHQIAGNLANTILYIEPGEMVMHMDDLTPEGEDVDDDPKMLTDGKEKKLLN